MSAVREASPPRREVRRTVTVLFCDLAGSTRLGERLDPESLRRVMSRYFEELSRAVECHGGTCAKFMGDAVMAVFGIPSLHEDDALRAVRAASEMEDALGRLNEELADTWDVRLEVRMGMNTGEVVTGIPSQDPSLLVGDAVNIAARLEEKAHAGEILMGEQTHRLVRNAVRTEPIDPLTLKGKTKPIAAFKLLGVLGSAAETGRDFDVPLVDRERELETLERAFEDAVQEPRCQLVTLVGPAGIGKSKLVHELIARLAQRANVLKGRCLPYGEGITFWPIAEVVKQAAEIHEDDSQDTASAKIMNLLPQDDHTAHIVRRVAGATGIADDPAPDRQGIFWATRKLFEALARERSLVVVLDDIHWGESTFLDLVEDLTEQSRDVPLVVISMARSELLEQRPGWAAAIPNAITVTLQPLDPPESRRLIQSFLGETDLDGEDVEPITAAANGNPLFLEEMLQMLIDTRVLQREDGRWRATGELSSFQVPPTIRALLDARIDQLGHEERAVIERAAVVGREFWPGAIRELSPNATEASLAAQFDALARKAFIQQGGTPFAGEEAFHFSHILIRDAAYEGMLKEVRADLHERFADWMERKAGERITEYEEILGFHLEQAYRYRGELRPRDGQERRLAQRAADHLAGSGSRALARGDMPAAVNLLERAVSLLPDEDPRRPDLLLKLGIALAETGELGRADALLSERIRQARRGLPFLSYRDPEGKQHVFDLEATTSRVTVGRMPSNDISLPWDSKVSRMHASIVNVQGRWALIDDGRSRNGSFVNGQRVADRHLLADGDILRFGDTLVLYRAPPTSEVQSRLDPRSTTATAVGLPAAVLLSETQRRVLIALCGLVEENRAAPSAAADQEIAKQLSLSLEAVQQNLWALSHVFDTEQLPEEERVARLVERARRSGLVPERGP
jgi:class 3 adenylate cyclase/pSer/pThr/pTyr-binding forkhead associated (FHA) protein